MRFEDKLSQGTPIRISVLGKSGVGKSALIVRFLTKRFIGEYRSNTDMLYKCSMIVNGSHQAVEIMDTSSTKEDITDAHLHWANGYVLVYSITDIDSFKWIARMLQVLNTQRPSVRVLVIGAKAELSHLREVEEVDGRLLALQNSCRFTELSSAENHANVVSAFERFLLEVKNYSRSFNKNSTLDDLPKRKISVSKMLGSLIGRVSPPSSPLTQLIILDRNEFTKAKALVQ